MPAVIPFIVQIGATAFTTWTATQIAVATFLSAVVVGKYSSDRAEEKARRAYNRSLQDRYVTVRSATATRKYVLGTVRTGGALMLGESILVAGSGWARAKSYLDVILAWAGNECELVGYFVDDEYVAVASFPPSRFVAVATSQRWMGDVTGAPTSATITVPYAPDSGSVVAYYTNASTGVATALTVSSISGTSVTLSGLPASTSVSVDLSYTTSTANKLRQQFKSGLGTQTSSDWGGDPASPRWTSNHRLRGVAHSRFACLWDEAAYQSGAPDFTAVLKGRGADGYPFYDPRTSTYPTYTDNPALLAAWWMTLPRARGGCGYPSDWIDWTAVGDAANICDELITVKTLDGSSTESIKRYQCHTVLDTGDAPLANLDKILRSMAGRRAFTSGKYKIVAGAFRAATVTITDADIVGTKPITLDATGGDTTPANIAKGTFADATKKWQATGPTTIRNSTYVTSDGTESTIDVDMPSTTDPRQASYLMGLALELSRPCFRGSLSVGGIGENIALFDAVQLSVTNRSAYAGRTFEIVSITDNWDGTFDLTLNEIKATSYALDYTTWTPLVQPTPPDMSYLWSVSAVAGLNVSVGSPQKLLDGKSVTSIALSWTAHSQTSVTESGKIEVRYRRIGDAAYTPLGTAEGHATGMSFSASLSDGATYEFQARARNGIGAVSSTWSSVYATVIGSKAFVSHAMSITPDPGVENPDAWVLGYGTMPSRYAAPAGSSYKFGAYLWNATASAHIWTKPVPVDQTRAYRAIAYALRDAVGDTAAMSLFVRFTDATGAVVYSAGGTWDAEGSYNYFGLTNDSPPTTTTMYEVAFGAGQVAQIPSNARFMSIGALMNESGTGGTYFAGRIQQLQETDLIAADAATEVYVSTNTGVSHASGNLDGGDSMCSISYTNDTDGDVTLVVSASGWVKCTFGSVDNPSYLRVLLVAGSVKSPLFAQYPYVVKTTSGTVEGGFSLTDRCVVAAGASVTINLNIYANNRTASSPATYEAWSYSDVVLRVEAVKR